MILLYTGGGRLRCSSLNRRLYDPVIRDLDLSEHYEQYKKFT